MPSCTVSTTAAFLLGSAFTYVVMTYLLKDDDEKKKSRDDNKQVAMKSRSIRNIASLRGSTVRSSVQTSAYAAISELDRAGFLSDIMEQLWGYVKIAGADMIRETVEPMFAEMLPGPLSKLRFTKIDLGNVPMRLDNVVVHDIHNGAVQFDLDLVWVTDTEITLKADYVGSFGIKSIELKGRMTFTLKPLTTATSVVSALQYSFINPPDLELDFSGLAAIADFKFLDKTIQSIMQDSMSIVVLPNRMSYKLDLATSFFDMYEPPVGIARVSLVRGEGFVVEKRRLGKDDIPDVYCIISLGEKKWRTSTIKDSLCPAWNESADFLLTDKDQIIDIHAWDEDNGLLDADDDLGHCRATVGEILLSGKTMDLELQQKEIGTGAFLTIHCDVCKLTPNLGSFSTRKGKHDLCGLLTILVTQAFNLPLEKEKAASFVKVTFGEYEFLTSAVTDYPGVDALNPVYDCAFHVPLTVEMVATGDSVVAFELINDIKTLLGTIKITQSELVAAADKMVKEKRKIGDQGAELEFLVSLRGVEEASTPTAAPSNRTKSQNVDEALAAAAPEEKETSVRVTVVRGHGFKVEKRGPFKKADIPDCYCKLRFGTSPAVWRTSTMRNNTEPEWNESSEYKLVDQGQVISIDVYDEDKGSTDPDDYLGSARIAIGKLLLAGGMAEVELMEKGNRTGSYITLRADLVT